jgi:anti-sigma factor RsiW
LNTHEHFEELCAAAASGQASEEEMAELKSHMETCPTCQRVVSDFMAISAQGLAPLAGKQSRGAIPSGMTGRFLARARSEGIDVSREDVLKAPTSRRRALFAGFVAAIAALLLIAAFLVIRYRKSLVPEQDRAQMPVQKGAPSPDASQAERQRLQQQLASARAETASMEIEMRVLHRELESFIQARISLNSRLVETKRENERIESEKAQWEARASRMEADIQKSRSEKIANNTELALQEAELGALRKQISDESEALEQQEALVSEGADIRDLVVARNLHIVDVHDRDGEGKDQRAFGRIFYTEGKSLVFYAYDLSDPGKVEAKVSFHLWGERLGADKPISNLGIFHSDDANDSRWVLAFDDPSVLAQIDSVFVTVEASEKTVREPRGRRILFAFLGDRPNHP